MALIMVYNIQIAGVLDTVYRPELYITRIYSRQNCFISGLYDSKY
jgi:hypothetical protein